jgi:hypothetical protein
MGGCGLDASYSDQKPLADCCEHGNEALGFIKSREFIDQMSDYQLLKKGSSLWS